MNEKADACELNDLILRVAHLENSLVNANCDETANEAYNKTLNLLIHGLEECTVNWGNLAQFVQFKNKIFFKC